MRCKGTTKIWNTQNYLCFGGKKIDLSGKPALRAAYWMLAYIKVAHKVCYDGEAVFRQNTPILSIAHSGKFQ